MKILNLHITGRNISFEGSALLEKVSELSMLPEFVSGQYRSHGAFERFMYQAC